VPNFWRDALGGAEAETTTVTEALSGKPARAIRSQSVGYGFAGTHESPGRCVRAQIQGVARSCVHEAEKKSARPDQPRGQAQNPRSSQSSWIDLRGQATDPSPLESAPIQHL
jgi:NAD(P)H-dependent flavin oxidoreductase YrpB (nitropropane dioxygenase family)